MRAPDRDACIVVIADSGRAPVEFVDPHDEEDSRDPFDELFDPDSRNELFFGAADDECEE